MLFPKSRSRPRSPPWPSEVGTKFQTHGDRDALLCNGRKWKRECTRLRQ
jgi:hypothetical protein